MNVALLRFSVLLIALGYLCFTHAWIFSVRASLARRELITQRAASAIAFGNGELVTSDPAARYRLMKKADNVHKKRLNKPKSITPRNVSENLMERIRSSTAHFSCEVLDVVHIHTSFYALTKFGGRGEPNEIK